MPAGVQLAEIESAGTAAEKALLADVKSKNSDATSAVLLRLFQVRRGWALVVRSADLLYLVPCAACSMCCMLRRTGTTRGHASFTGTGAQHGMRPRQAKQLLSQGYDIIRYLLDARKPELADVSAAMKPAESSQLEAERAKVAPFAPPCTFLVSTR
jgi:hypothetical protein